MGEINNLRIAEKALGYLWSNEPHDIEKMRKLHEKSGIKVPIEWLIVNNPWEKWTKEERLKLIKISEYDMDNRRITAILNGCIRDNNYFGFDLLLSAGAKISPSTIYDEIVRNHQIDDDTKLNYCQRIIETYKNYDGIPMVLDSHYFGEKTICYNASSLLDDRNRFSSDLVFHDQEMSLVDKIASTKDNRLFQLLLSEIKDPSLLLFEALTTGDLDRVKKIIDAGANLDCLDIKNAYHNPTVLDETEEKMIIDNDFEIKYTTPSYHKFFCPLLLAIIYNKLDMVKLLVESGCNVNFIPVKDANKEILPYIKKIAKERRREFPEVTMTPLEYIVTWYSFDKDSKGHLDINIIKYLYDNGATFNNGQVDYNRLIEKTMEANGKKIVKYFLNEAYKKGAKVDFEQLFEEPDFVLSIPNFAKYSKKLDYKHHEQNVKRYLTTLFKSISSKENCPLKDSKHYELIKDYSKELSKKVLETIPIPSCYCDKESLEELISLGYNVNAVDERGYTPLQHCVDLPFKKENSEKIIEERTRIANLIEHGCNPNYINENGKSALGIAIMNGKFDLAKKLVDCADEDVAKSKMVQNAVQSKLVGYLQHYHSDILFKLAAKGLTIDNEYFRKTIESVSILGFDLYVKGIKDTDIWNFLDRFYRAFDNEIVGYNYHFPGKNKFKDYEYDNPEAQSLLWLIKEHLNRCFVTKEEQLDDEKYITKESAAWKLIEEITRYVSTLDYRLIIDLIKSFPIIDVEELTKSHMMEEAFNNNPNLYGYLLALGVEPSAKLVEEQQKIATEAEEQKELVSLLQNLGCTDADKYVLKRRKGV